MGQMIDIARDGATTKGYLAGAEGPGVLVIQEWWGLNDHIKDVVDRFAGEGFVALAPDLYNGEISQEPDGAGKLMMSMNIDEAYKQMSLAVDELIRCTARPRVGVIGFCMGGGLALVIACRRPDAVAACAPFYGLIPWQGAQPDWSKLEAKIEGHYAADDHSFPPEKVEALETQLRALGKDVRLLVYPEVDHAFFNDTRPEVYNADAAQTAWLRVLDLFRSQL
jgi:carboxymethylenebutenolidase